MIRKKLFDLERLEKIEQRKNIRKYVTLGVLSAVVLMCFFSYIYFQPHNVGGGFTVTLDNIEYVNLSEKGLTCYEDMNDMKFSDEYCPIPHHISISGRLDASINYFIVDVLAKVLD